MEYLKFQALVLFRIAVILSLIWFILPDFLELLTILMIPTVVQRTLILSVHQDLIELEDPTWT